MCTVMSWMPLTLQWQLMCEHFAMRHMSCITARSYSLARFTNECDSVSNAAASRTLFELATVLPLVAVHQDMFKTFDATCCTKQNDQISASHGRFSQVQLPYMPPNISQSNEWHSIMGHCGFITTGNMVCNFTPRNIYPFTC